MFLVPAFASFVASGRAAVAGCVQCQAGYKCGADGKASCNSGNAITKWSVPGSAECSNIQVALRIYLGPMPSGCTGHECDGATVDTVTSFRDKWFDLDELPACDNNDFGISGGIFGCGLVPDQTVYESANTNITTAIATSNKKWDPLADIDGITCATVQFNSSSYPNNIDKLDNLWCSKELAQGSSGVTFRLRPAD